MEFMEKNYVEHKEDVQTINQYVANTPEMFVRNAEQQYRASVCRIVREVADSHRRIIMLAGPSASGKTTTSLILREEFARLQMQTLVISLDNFFKGRELAPLLPNGQYDYECLEALNVEQMQRCLMELIKTGATSLPVFDFIAGQPRTQRNEVEITDRHVVVVEGIHALNPAVTDHLPSEALYKVYISVKQGVTYEGKELLSAHDIRLLRRLVRDYQFRGSSAENTFSMWTQVREGEKQYIRPFRRTADATLNSIHMYEPCVLKDVAIPLLDEVGEDSSYYQKARRLERALGKFVSLPSSLIPNNSLVREFLGDSVYYE